MYVFECMCAVVLTNHLYMVPGIKIRLLTLLSYLTSPFTVNPDINLEGQQ